MGGTTFRVACLPYRPSELCPAEQPASSMVSTATAPLDGAVYAFLQKYFNEGQQRANGAAQAVVERPREDSKRRPAYRPLRPVWLSVCRASRRSAIRAANLLFAPSAAVSRAAR